VVHTPSRQHWAGLPVKFGNALPGQHIVSTPGPQPTAVVVQAPPRVCVDGAGQTPPAIGRQYSELPDGQEVLVGGGGGWVGVGFDGG